MSLNDEDFMRYSRQLLLEDIGEDGQKKLNDARVLIVGIGGLGCPVAMYLAAAGVGFIGLCDPDLIDRTNLQRQVLYRTEDCGVLKVLCAKAQLNALNPTITIEPYAIEVNEAMLDNNYNLVIDCTDNLPSRQIINTTCYAKKIPFISAAAIGWEGQLVAFDFSQHRRLCFNCVINYQSGEPLMNCSNSGVVGPVLGIMGSCQATTAMRILLGFFQQHGELQRYDGKRGQWLTIQATIDTTCSICG